MNEWEVQERMPKYNDINEFEVWVDGNVRSVRRVGNWSLSITPGTLVFTDCTQPMQNVLCHEPLIQGWRLKEEKA